MVSRSRALSESPDPLALTSPSHASGSRKRALTKSQSWTPLKKVVVEIESPKKRRTGQDGTPERGMSNAKSTGTTKRTPLSRASPSTNRGTPTPRSKPGTKMKAETPLRTGSPKVLKTPRTTGKPTLASSVRNALPTPSKINTPVRVTDDNPFLDEPSGSAVSRETFLANEALRRQKEARNFEYEGDADAPKLTRSGRVVGGATRRIDVDEYGDEVDEDEDEDEDEELDVDAMEVDVPETEVLRVPSLELEVEPIVPDANITGLPSEARPHVLRILSTLTSQGIASNPPPFFDEDTNEALTGLVNLLQATVERGEGNSALVVGPRGVGKTRTVARALSLVPSSSKTAPIVVRLSGYAQINDRLAIKEIGRQIAEAEGIKAAEDEVDAEEEQDDQEYAPTTLPSHLLALLTAPSPRAIIIILEEFDMFTEHARQALLYCLLDVVQSVKTGDVKTTGRGVAVIGVTSRVDTLLLLEKRVKSRFSHRMWRIPPPLSPGGPGWKTLLTRALVPWEWESAKGFESKELRVWKDDWQYGIETLMDHPKVVKYLDRLTSLTTDVRLLYKPFIPLVTSILSSKLDLIPVSSLCASILAQIEQSGWGLQNAKLKGLSHPALGVLIISKHLHYAGRDEFNFAQVEEEYLRFSRTKLVGSGKTRWPVGVLRNGYDHLLRLGLLAPASSGNAQRRFAKVRCTLSPHEVVAWFKGDGAAGLGPELVSWGRMMGGHA